MPLGANINRTKQNGTRPNQENQKNLQEKEVFPNPFKNNPTLEILESKA